VETLNGVVARFDHAMILHKDTHYLGYVRSELIDLTVKYGKLAHLEIAIGGYDDDPRALYEVPEVRRWVRIAHEIYPDSLLWMTPGSLWVWVLCLNPQMCSKLPEGQTQIAFDPTVLVPQFAASIVAGEAVLEQRGLREEQCETISEQARRNYQQMFERRKLGADYLLVHPDEMRPVVYQRVP
jgi:hypothetical protein